MPDTCALHHHFICHMIYVLLIYMHNYEVIYQIRHDYETFLQSLGVFVFNYRRHNFLFFYLKKHNGCFFASNKAWSIGGTRESHEGQIGSHVVAYFHVCTSSRSRVYEVILHLGKKDTS
jgi:hypothetical protein